MATQYSKERYDWEYKVNNTTLHDKCLKEPLGLKKQQNELSWLFQCCTGVPVIVGFHVSHTSEDAGKGFENYINQNVHWILHFEITKINTSELTF